MMRHAVLSLLFFSLTTICLSAGSLSEIQIEDVLVRRESRSPEGLNIRVRLSNPGHSTVGPLQTVLWVRRDKNEPWREVQRWEIESLTPGRRLARDFLPSAFGRMDPAFYLDQFQLRVAVAVPNQSEVTREFSWSEGEKTPREGRVQTDGTNKESPVRIVHLMLFDSTPYYVYAGGEASSLGEVRASTKITNTAEAPLKHVSVRLQVLDGDGYLLQEFTRDLDSLEAHKTFELTSPLFRNYSLAQLRVRVLIEHDTLPK